MVFLFRPSSSEYVPASATPTFAARQHQRPEALPTLAARTDTAHPHGTPVVATDEPCELFEWARDGSIAELRSGLCLGVADGLGGCVCPLLV